MKRKLTKIIFFIIWFLAFYFFLKKSMILAGVIIIFASIWCIISKLNGADIELITGILLISIGNNNSILFAIAVLLLASIAIYDMNLFYRIKNDTDKSDNENSWLEKFHEKQIISLLLKKITSWK